MCKKKQNFEIDESKLTQEQQLELAREGTEEALTALVMDNVRAGFAYGRSYSGNRFQDDELLSIVYQAMMTAVHRFEPEQNKELISYCKPFIRGELHRAWKKKAPSGVHFPDFLPSQPVIHGPDDDRDPSEPSFGSVNFDFDAVDRKAIASRIQPWLPRLTQHERLTVDLVFFGGYSQTDAARLMGVERQAVEQVLRRVYRKFRGWLK